jgi:hypothetical protein
LAIDGKYQDSVLAGSAVTIVYTVLIDNTYLGLPNRSGCWFNWKALPKTADRNQPAWGRVAR